MTRSESVERMGSCDDRRAVVVTGASSGIGRAIARDLARCGYQVFGSVRSVPDAEALSRDCGHEVRALIMDVTSPEQIGDATDELCEELDGAGLYGLINNAGAVVAGPLERIDAEEFRHVLDVNVIGVARVTQALLPAIARGGRVVNMGSISGRVTLPFNGPYSASKMALVALTRCQRMELRARDIHVSLLQVGNVRSPLFDKVRAQVAQLDDAATSAAADGLSAYREPLRRGASLLEGLARGAGDKEAVVRAVKHVLASEQPKHTYIVGADAWRWHIAERLLPYRAIEWALCRQMGLGR